MSNKKLEQVLDLLINEETARAEQLLHEFVVEKARTIYESLVSEEFGDEDELENDNDEVEVGGDETEDFIDSVSDDEADIEADELNDGEVESSDDSDLSDQIGELSDQLAELRDMFNQLVSAELDEPEHADAEFDFVDGDDDVDMDSDMDSDVDDLDSELDMGVDDEVKEMYEATTMHNKVPTPANQEGKLAGTGKGSKVGATGKESPYTKAPSKVIDGADPVDFTGEENSKGSAVAPKKQSVTTMNVPQKKVNTSGQDTEGKLAGTGKGSKVGATGKESPLSKAPKL